MLIRSSRRIEHRRRRLKRQAAGCAVPAWTYGDEVAVAAEAEAQSAAAETRSLPNVVHAVPEALEVRDGVVEDKAGSQHPTASPSGLEPPLDGAEEVGSPELILLGSDDGDDEDGDGRGGINDGSRKADGMGGSGLAARGAGSSGGLGEVVAASPFSRGPDPSLAASAHPANINAVAQLRAMVLAVSQTYGGNPSDPMLGTAFLKQEEEGEEGARKGEVLRSQVLRSNVGAPALSSAGGSEAAAAAGASDGSRKRKAAGQQPAAARLAKVASRAAAARWSEATGGPLPPEARGVPFDVDERGPDEFDAGANFDIEYILSVRLVVCVRGGGSSGGRLPTGWGCGAEGVHEVRVTEPGLWLLWPGWPRGSVLGQPNEAD